MRSSLVPWICPAITSGLALGRLGDGLVELHDVRALAPVPAGLLLAVHLAQLRARVVAAAGRRAAGVGGEDDAVARLGQLEELGVVVRELRALDGVRAALLAGGQGQVPLVGVDQLGGELRRGAARARGRRRGRGGRGGGGRGVVGGRRSRRRRRRRTPAPPRAAGPPRSPRERSRPARWCRAPATRRSRPWSRPRSRRRSRRSRPRRRPCRRRPGRSRRGRRARCRGGTGSGPPRRPHRPRTARRRRRRRRRCPGAPGRNRPARARPLRSARAGWPAAGGCSARDGLGGANAEPRTCLPKPRAGWTSGVGVRRAGGESRCPVPRPVRSGFEEKPSGRFPSGCLCSGEVDVRRDERWNPRRREGRAAPGRATSGRRVASGRHAGVHVRCGRGDARRGDQIGVARVEHDHREAHRGRRPTQA